MYRGVRTKLGDEIQMVHQESAILALLSDALRAAEVEVDRVDGRKSARVIMMIENEVSGGKEGVGVISAELDDERAVEAGKALFAGREVELLGAVLGLAVVGEQAGMDHGRIAELGPIVPRQNPPRKLRRIYHRRYHVPRRP